jgi:hypothetical protein
MPNFAHRMHQMALRLLWLWFVLLLAISGMAKLINMPGFYPVVANYQVLPALLVTPAAWALALTEVGLALWLASRWQARRAAGLVVGLHALYWFWLLAALLRGLALSNCGCFGAYWARPLTLYSLLEDGILLAMSLWLWRSSPPAKFSPA